MAFVYPQPAFAQKAPRFFLSNFEGKRFDSRKHKGPYVVSFFFVNCPPCIKEMPELQHLMETELPNAPPWAGVSEASSLRRRGVPAEVRKDASAAPNRVTPSAR